MRLNNLQTKFLAVEKNLDNMKDELADIFIYTLLFANETGIDLGNAVEQKIQKNNEKYPINKAYGRNIKYTEF